LLWQDYTSQEMAAQLHITAATIDDHRKAIAHKLGVCGKVAFRKALRLLEKHFSTLPPPTPGNPTLPPPENTPEIPR
jgi:predicted Zn-dependent peptidase